MKFFSSPSKKLVLALSVLLLAAAPAAQAVTATFQILMDFDPGQSTGCLVATADGPVSGVDRIEIVTVDTVGAASAQVSLVQTRSCVSAPSTFSVPAPVPGVPPTPYPVGIGNGEANFNVIEVAYPLSLNPSPESPGVRVAVTSTTDGVLTDAVAEPPILLPLLGTIQVPTLDEVGLVTLALLLAAAALVVLRRRRSATAFLVAFLLLGLSGLAFAAVSDLNGNTTAEWGEAIERLDPTGPPDPPGADISAFFVMEDIISGVIYFRIDSSLLFTTAPTAVDDAYNALRDTPLNVAAATGVTTNDTLNGAAIVSYGATTGAEQTTIGAVTPTSAGGSIALNLDGSFTYNPPPAYLGSDTFEYIIQNAGGSSTATVTLTVRSDQTITFTSSPPVTPTVGGATYTVTATATSGLPVTFTIDPSASTVCSIAGSTVSFIGNGTCVINADQAGNASYNPAPQVQQSFTVKSDQTISFTSSPPAAPTVGGATYAVTATATSGLPVTFTIDPSASTVCSIAGSTVSFIGNGTCVINANQAGDATYNPAPQVQQSFAVKSDQTITFTSSPPATPTVGGPTYTVTATATSGLTVTFTIDPSASAVCSIAGSTVSFIGNGTCVINANQAGDATFNPAPQVQQSFGVKSDQTITFTSSPPATPTVGGATYTVTATATSGLTVTFTIDPSASTVCSIAGSTVSFIGNGTCVINANQAGDANFNPAPQVEQSFGVKTDQTISFTSSPPATPTVGGPTYTVTATATSGLPVTFTIDPSASTVCTIAGSTVSFIGNGTCVINANQAGDANFNPAPQVQQSCTVKTAQTISFTSSPPAMPTVGGPTYTVTATATSGLPVTFTIDPSASTVCTIAGSTVSFIGNGTCVINANQAGDANFYPAPQVQQSCTVKTAQTISFTSSPPATPTVGGPTYTVTATATSGLPVTFTIDPSASTVCTIAGSTVSFIGNGTCVINANQAGDANFYPAPQMQQSCTVKTAQTISFTSSPPATPTVGGPTYTVTATATSGLPVTFTIDPSASTVCTIAGSTVSFIGNGTCVINANQAGDANFYPAPQVQQSCTVKTAQTISFTSSPPATPTVGGPTYTVTATATSGLPVTFTIDPSASTVCTIAGSTVSFIGNGTCVINANQAGDANFYPAPQVQQSCTVKTAQTISFTSSPPVMATVGGATYTVTATATSGLPVTFTIDPSASTVCTIAGSTVSFIGNGACVINANQAGDANFYPAPQMQQSCTVKTAQTISFTSSPPATPTVGGATYTVTATATSGLPVTFTIDPSASTVCSIAGSTVSFIGNGTCVINANQAGNANFYPAPQVQQSCTVKSLQTITFTSTPPSPGQVGGPTYTVTATATSGLPVTFTIDPSASTVCSIAGSTVSFLSGGTCVINANQPGDANYYAAPQVQQSFHVNFPPQIPFPGIAAYVTPGNTQLHGAGAVLAGVAAWTDAVGLIAKSGATDPDSGPGSLSVVPNSGVTGNGGSYSVTATGSFTYVPAVGFTGVDSFSFQVTDTLDATAGTVNVTVGPRVWYIHDVTGANNPVGGDGRSTNAFDSIAAFNAATTNNGDIIFVFEGGTGTTPHTGSISLKDGQKLWGQGIALNVPGFGTPLVTATNKPRIRTTTASTDVVTVPATVGNRQNVEIRGLDLEATGATSNAIDVTSSGANVIGVTISDNTIRGATAEGIDVNQGSTSASSTLALSDNTLTASGAAADVQASTGTLTVTAFHDNIVTDTSVGGIVVAGIANPVVFDATPGGAIQPVPGGTTVIGTPGDRINGPGLTLSNVTGALNYANAAVGTIGAGDLDIFTDSGAALSVSGGAGGFDLDVTPNVGMLVANAGPAAVISATDLNLQLNSLTSSNSASSGVSLTTVSGTFSAPSGSSITKSSGGGTAFSVASSSATVNYGGTLNVTSGAGVSLTSNTGATNFTGTMTLKTGANAGFSATGGGTVTATGSGSSIKTTSGTALLVNGATINPGGLNFDCISAGRGDAGVGGGPGCTQGDASGTPANGIFLNSTGTGVLTVNGDGSNTSLGGNSSGGVVQNTIGSTGSTAGIGVYVNNARAVLRRMNIHDHPNYGIFGGGSTAFTLEYSTINSTATATSTNGDSAAADDEEGSVAFEEWAGSGAITSSIIGDGFSNNLRVLNTNGADLNRLTVSNSRFDFNGQTAGNDQIHLESRNSGTTLNFTLTGSTVKGARADWFNASANSSSTMDTIVTGNAFTNIAPDNHPATVANGNRILVSANATHTFEVANNTLKGSLGNALAVTGAAAGAVMTGDITNNDIGDAAIANSGSTGAGGISVQSGAGADITVLVDGNDVRQYNNHGIIFTLGDQMGGAATINATVSNNTTNTPGTLLTDFNGFHVNSGTVATDNLTSCFNIFNNNFTGGGKGAVAPNNSDARLRQRQGTTIQLPGYTGPARDNGDLDVAEVITYLRPAGSGGLKNNTFGTGNANSVSTGGGYVNSPGGALCPTP